MTAYNQDINTGFFSGNHKDIEVPVKKSDGSAKDLTSSEITFALFNDRTEEVYIRKSSSDINEISIDDAVNGILTVHLLPTDTFNINGTFRYHINVVDSSGYEETVTVGRIVILPSYAKRFMRDSLPAYLAGI